VADENGPMLEGKRKLRQNWAFGPRKDVVADGAKEGANVIMLSSYLVDFCVIQSSADGTKISLQSDVGCKPTNVVYTPRDPCHELSLLTNKHWCVCKAMEEIL